MRLCWCGHAEETWGNPQMNTQTGIHASAPRAQAVIRVRSNLRGNLDPRKGKLFGKDTPPPVRSWSPRAARGTSREGCWAWPLETCFPPPPPPPASVPPKGGCTPSNLRSQQPRHHQLRREISSDVLSPPHRAPTRRSLAQRRSSGRENTKPVTTGASPLNSRGHRRDPRAFGGWTRAPP